MKCENCNTEIEHDWRKSPKTKLRFCSRKCSNKRVHTPDSRRKISSTLSEKYMLGELKLPVREVGQLKLTKVKVCNFCKKEFIANRKYLNDVARWPTVCSDECYIQTKRKNARGNKNIEYKGVRYDSLWEIDMVKFFEDNNITFIVPSSIPWVDVAKTHHKYFPDFYIPILDLYVDPKNPLVIKQQTEKLEIISKQINLIYGDLEMLKTIIMEKLAGMEGVAPSCF